MSFLTFSSPDIHHEVHALHDPPLFRYHAPVVNEWWLSLIMSFFRKIFFAGFCLFCAVAQASLSSKINSLINNQSGAMQIGAYVTNAATGKLLYSYNGNTPMTPASNTKVMTSSAAFLYLGPNYHFVTSVVTTGKVQKNVLTGNVYVVFSGDPTLTTQDVYTLFKAVRAAGITSIHGNVIIDQTVFSGPYYGLGWPQDDLAYCYAAPVAGAIINENCMALQVVKNKKGRTPVVRQYTTNFPVVNHLALVGQKELRTCVFQPTITTNNAILLQGCLPARADWGFAFAIKNPQSYARQVVQVALSKAGIAVNGSVQAEGKAPGKARVLASHSSDSLQTLLAYMLKHSDNVYAGAVTKLLGQEYYGVGTYKAGANAIASILASRIGSSFSPPYLEDGSGESVYNLISPKELVQVYNYMYGQPQLINTFMQSLAISGQVGTLSYRLTTNGLAGHVYGKTGTINGVSTLSGYLALPGKPTITFAIMMNGVHRNFNAARAVQDQIVQAIANNI